MKTADHLDRPEVSEMIGAALDAANPAIDPKAKRRMVIKVIAAKQRPRRSASGR